LAIGVFVLHRLAPEFATARSSDQCVAGTGRLIWSDPKRTPKAFSAEVGELESL
jgi:hypothetical protein